jgi:hypothetical protein
MFGLTRREQRWKAEQQVAEVPAPLVATAIKAAADIQVAEAQTESDELSRLRDRYNELIFAVGTKWPGETRHETALRYIKRMEEPETTALAKVPDNAELCGGTSATNAQLGRESQRTK